MSTAAEAVLTSLKTHGAKPDALTPAVRLVVTPLRSGIGAAGGVIDVLVEAYAEAGTTPVKANALNLAFVIDRSGSMQGQPLAEAKRCVAAMLRRMKPTDRAAIVVYDNTVDIPVVSAPVAEILPVLEQRLASIHHRGMTALHAGWLGGAEQVAPWSSGTALSRVILLSDGNANQGLTDVAQIVAQCAALADTSVSTSTYGLGENFNETLMTEMAAKGNGLAYYGETASDLMPKFEAEFDALAATVGRDPSLVTVPAAECLNDYRLHKDGGWLMPNLVEGAASWALFRFTLPAAAIGASHGLSFKVGYLDSDGKQVTAETSIAVAVVADEARLAEDGKVAGRVAEIQAAGIQKTAREAAEREDWSTVEGAVAQLRDVGKDSAYITGVVNTLEELAKTRQTAMFAKEAMFASTSMMRSYSGLSDDALELNAMAAPSFARRSARQGKGEPKSS